MRRLIGLALEHGLAQILQADLLRPLAYADSIDRDFGTGGHALDVVLLAIHGARHTAVIAFAKQVDAVIAGATPNGILGLRIDPHRLLREVETRFADVAKNADGGAGTPFELGIADLVGTIGEHHGGEQQADHDGKDH